MRHLVESLFATGATCAGPVLLAMGVRAQRVRQLMLETPTSRIRSLAMGMVELNGKVAPRSRLFAPFTGRACAWWEVEVQTRTARDKHGTSARWHTVHRDRSGSPFYLTDSTGTALVYPQGADVRLRWDAEEETNGFGVPECYRDWMKEKGLAMAPVWSLGPMRFRERVLEEDLSVYVLGRATPRAQSTNVSWDEDALQATGTETYGAAHVRSHDAAVTAVIRRAEHDPAFVVSLQSEKSMTLEYGLKAAAGVAGGPLVTLFGVWCLLELAKSQQLFR